MYEVAERFHLDPEVVWGWPRRKLEDVLKWMKRSRLEPGRTELYLMQLTLWCYYAAHPFGGAKEKNLFDFLLKTKNQSNEEERPEPGGLTKEQIEQIRIRDAKDRWRAKPDGTSMDRTVVRLPSRAEAARRNPFLRDDAEQ